VLLKKYCCQAPTQLLSDDNELFSLEDAGIEVLPTTSVDASSVEKDLYLVLKIRLSKKVAADGTLSRQLRRKFAQH
jgi:hypothetical protein